MKTGARRRWPLLLIVALLIPYVVVATESPVDQVPTVESVGDGDRQIPNDQIADQAVFHNTHHEDHAPVPGAAAVQEARSLLQKLRPATRRTTRFSKPTGFLGSFIYYIKELFALLFMNGTPKTDALRYQSSFRKLSEPLSGAINLLEIAAGESNADAIYLLAEMNFYGYYMHPRNFTNAFQRYQELAALDGNSSAQHMVGFMHATGIGGAVEKNQAKALLYHTFAADAGDTRSQMTTAFRHYAGIGTPRNCEKAVHYYQQVAEKAMHYTRSGPPGGHSTAKEAYRLADEQGGVYGEGASVISSGLYAKQGGTGAEANAGFDDVLEYLDLMSRKGELRATFNLGRLHYDGSRALRPDLRVAKEYFYDVARRYWTKEGKIRQDTEPGVDKLASKAAGYLGRMFLRGEGMEQNFSKARIWFKRGIDNGDALSQFSMGLMHLYGHGVAKDPVKAAEYFGAAADQDMASAQVRLGTLLMDQGDLATAAKYFELAARNQHIEAFYYLAEMSNLGAGRDRNCNVAASYYKIVVEKAETIHSSFFEANEAYEDGDLDTALPLYMMAAEQGYEAGQANVAYLLDTPNTQSPLTKVFPWFRAKVSSLLGDASLALIYWTRSAKQANIDSLVKMGDYYLLGLGTDNSVPDAEKAAACYQAAAETLQSAQAMWNLGWMHENGIGIEQDFHLAKRFYDQSGDLNAEAYAPVAIALFKLRVRGWWNWLSGGNVKGIRDDDLPRKRYSFSEWVANFLAADLEAYEADYLARDNDGAILDEWDSSAMPGGDDLYGGGDDIWLDDEGLLEALIILGLTAALALLVYYRQQRAVRARREALAQGAEAGPGNAPPPPPEQGGAEGQGQRDRGLFPMPDNPDFLNWAAGGIGH